jgi:hypothetical protein
VKEHVIENVQGDEPQDGLSSPLSQVEGKSNVTQKLPESESNAPPAQQHFYARLIAFIETGLIVAGMIILFQVLPFRISGDGKVRYKALSLLLEHGKLMKMKYSFIGPAFSIPLWYLDRMKHDSMWWLARYNFIIFAIGLVVIYLVLRKWFDHSLIRKFILLLIAASMFPAHLVDYYSEVFTALCVGFGILAALFSSRLGGWLAVVLGVANTPASIVALACVVLKHALDSKRWRTALIIGAAACLIFAESWIRTGQLLNNAYNGDAGDRTIMPYTGLPGFSYPFLFGLLSIVFSFGKGLIFFAPGLLLPIRKTLLGLQQERKRDLFRVYVLWMLFVVGLILLYSRWWAWYGGWFWGPRFFLIASIPASFALAVRLHYPSSSLVMNVLTAVIFCLSAWLGFSGTVYNPFATTTTCWAHHFALEALCHYTPEFSVLWYPLVIHEPIRAVFSPYITFCVIAFLYLLIPLLGQMLNQAIKLGKDFGKEYLNFEEWQV